MRRILTLAGREIRGALSSPLAWVFLLLFAWIALLIFLFREAFFSTDRADLRGFFRWAPELLALVAPALTMRLWAEERKLGTYELLATLPLTTWELVSSKFLAALTLLVLALVSTAAIPLTAAAWGDLDWGPVVGGYLGCVLLGATFLAAGLVCSSLVQDQLLALFLGWIACAALLLPGADLWTAILPPGPAEGLRSFGFGSRFAGLERGAVSLADMVLYLSTTAWLLYVNRTVLRWRREAA